MARERIFSFQLRLLVLCVHLAQLQNRPTPNGVSTGGRVSPFKNSAYIVSPSPALFFFPSQFPPLAAPNSLCSSRARRREEEVRAGGRVRVSGALFLGVLGLRASAQNGWPAVAASLHPVPPGPDYLARLWGVASKVCGGRRRVVAGSGGPCGWAAFLGGVITETRYTPSFTRDPGSSSRSRHQLYNSPQKSVAATRAGDRVGEVKGTRAEKGKGKKSLASE